MTPEEKHHAALAAHAPLVEAIGNRIFPDVIPQDRPLPAVAYTRTDTEPFYGLDGTLRASRARIATQAWAPGKAQVESVGDGITAALALQGVAIEGRASVFDDETGLYGVSIDCDWWS